MMKKVLLLATIFLPIAMYSQVILDKNECQSYYNKGNEYVFCNKTNENSTIAIKNSNVGIKVALQRNAIARNFEFTANKSNINTTNEMISIICENKDTIYIEPKHISFLINNYCLKFALTKTEYNRIKTYLEKNIAKCNK